MGRQQQVRRRSSRVTLVLDGPAIVEPVERRRLMSAGDLISVTAQPTTVTAGVPFAVSADLLANGGSTDTTATDPVTVSIASGPAGTALGGTTTVAAVGGAATLAGLSLTDAGAYTLTLAGTGLAPATTATVVVQPAAAAQLSVLVPPPPTVVAGTPFSVIAAVTDAYGNPVTTDTSDARVDFATAAAPDLFGDPTTTAASGIAEWDGLTVDAAGTYSLVVTDGALTAADTDPFTVTAAAPAGLAFVAHPAGGTAGPLAPVAVDVVDAYGNPVDTATPAVTLSTDGAAAGADPLAGTTTVAAVGGVATFAAATLDVAGSYQLHAAANGLSAADSAPFVVTPGPAFQVVFNDVPTTATAGATLAPFTVAVEDQWDNLVPTDTSTVTLASDPGVLAGGSVTATAVGGVATFKGVVLNSPGVHALGISDPEAIFPEWSLVTVSPAPVPTPTLPTVVAGAKLPPIVATLPQAATAKSIAARRMTLSVLSGPGGLFGPTTAVAVNGKATFAAAGLTKAGQYTLVVKDAAGRTATTETVVVVPAAPRTMSFAVAPAVADPTGAATVSATVAVVDKFGNPIPTAAGATVNCRVAYPSRGSRRPAFPAGVATAAVVAGQAAFAAVPVTGVGTFDLMFTCPSAATLYTSKLLSVGGASVGRGHRPR